MDALFVAVIATLAIGVWVVLMADLLDWKNGE